MLSALNNFSQNILLAWKYGNSVYEEPSVWSEKKPVIILLKDFHEKRHRSYKRCFFDALGKILEMTRNTFSSYGATSFDLAKKVLTVNEGLYRSVVCYPTLFRTYLFVSDPNVMKAVLSHERNETGNSAFFSGGGPTQISRRILGENLLSYESEKHRAFVRQIGPFLKFKTFFYENFEKSTQLTLEQWMREEEKAPIFFLPNLIVNAICRCFFDWTEDTQEITASVNALLSNVSNPYSEIYRKASKLLDQRASQMIEKVPITELNGLDKQELHTFVKLMFFAGQDTTSAFLEYLIYILGKDENGQSLQQKIFLEWQESRKPIIIFAKESPTLNALFQEGIRLHPPSFEQTRETVNALVIEKKMFIPSGTSIHLNHFFSQRDQRRWGLRSQGFFPARFLEGGKSSPLYPFSSGPTVCLGKQFSLILSKIFIMKLICEYTWETISECNALGGTIAFKVSPDVRVRLTKR